MELHSVASENSFTENLRLYHTGFEIIRQPDIRIGRKNADFGQGFYLSDNPEFSKRWAKPRKDASPVLNEYELCAEGLAVKRLDRDVEWFDYIFGNRSGYADSLWEYDVIIGPIASDTLYDTWGIITSGLLRRELALELLQMGPLYTQIVIKTEKAVRQLRFISAANLTENELAPYKGSVDREEEEYQLKITKRLEKEQEFSD